MITRFFGKSENKFLIPFSSLTRRLPLFLPLLTGCAIESNNADSTAVSLYISGKKKTKQKAIIIPENFIYSLLFSCVCVPLYFFFGYTTYSISFCARFVFHFSCTTTRHDDSVGRYFSVSKSTPRCGGIL